ncbi:hypothetical protein GCM10028827_42250 [Mucilaginibacter myungsuensis]
MLSTLCASAQLVKTYNQKGYTLNFTNNDPTLDSVVQRRMIETFFKVYPALANEYNKNTAKTVTIAIDKAYDGVAATGDAHVVVNPEWMRKHPEDIDVVTHEVMHIVQDYGDTNGPGWLTEGIADFARNKFGINNAAAKWSIGGYNTKQNYDNSYNVTARFLYWIEKKKKKGIVQVLDKQMRDHKYVDTVWADQTGKTLDQLWVEYAANPDVS